MLKKELNKGEFKQNRNENNCHSRMLLSGISTAFNSTQGGDPRTLRAATSSGMTAILNNTPSSVLTGHLPPYGEAAHFNVPSTSRERAECVSTGVRGKIARGFTLIELLVVVLIIGILTAVALPQYQVAVTKSRYASLKHLVRSIVSAQEVYYLANNKYATNFAELDIDMPGDTLDTSDDSNYVYKWGACYIYVSTTATFFGCSNSLTSMAYQVYASHSLNYPNRKTCMVYNTDTTSVQARVCTSETGNGGRVAGTYQYWDY